MVNYIALHYLSINVILFYRVTYYFMFFLIYFIVIINIDIVLYACMSGLCVCVCIYIYMCVCIIMTCCISNRSDDLVYDPLNEN
jgi:hypothetical protein